MAFERIFKAHVNKAFGYRYQRRSVEGCTYGVASGFIICLTEVLLFRFWSLLVTKHLLPYWHSSGILLGARGTGFVMFWSLERLLDGLMLKQRMWVFFDPLVQFDSTFFLSRFSGLVLVR